MKTMVKNQPFTIATDKLMQLTDGISLFIGVTNVEKDTFFPFYGLGSIYTGGFLFETEDMMKIHDTEDLWPDNNPIAEIEAEFNRHKADYPAAVTNVELFAHFVKMARIRESRRVLWVGNPAEGQGQGYALKVDDQEVHVLWDEHIGSKLPSFDYALNDERIQPVGDSE